MRYPGGLLWIVKVYSLNILVFITINFLDFIFFAICILPFVTLSLTQFLLRPIYATPVSRSATKSCDEISIVNSCHTLRQRFNINNNLKDGYIIARRVVSGSRLRIHIIRGTQFQISWEALFLCSSFFLVKQFYNYFFNLITLHYSARYIF